LRSRCATRPMRSGWRRRSCAWPASGPDRAAEWGMRTRPVVFLLLLAPAVVAQTPAPRGFDARLTQYALPVPVQMVAIETAGQTLEMAFMDVPAAHPNGRTVVLLHGKNFSGAYWAPTIRALNGAGYRVIAPDQIGFGKSSKPEGFEYSFHRL